MNYLAETICGEIFSLSLASNLMKVCHSSCIVQTNCRAISMKHSSAAVRPTVSDKTGEVIHV